MTPMIVDHPLLQHKISLLRKMLFSIFGLSRFRRRSRILISCRLEPPPPLSHIVQFSVKRHAHWINSRSLYCFHARISSS